MSDDSKDSGKKRPWWLAAFATGAAVACGVTNYIYIQPKEKEIIALERQLDEAKSSPELQRLTLQIQQLQSNRDDWMNYAKKLEPKAAAYDSNTVVLEEISKLAAAKRKTDYMVDFYLSISQNAGAEESKYNLLRANEYRRQAIQIHEQILGFESKISK